MKKSCNWIPFDSDRIGEAAHILIKSRIGSIGREVQDSDYTLSEAIKTIKSEIQKDVVHALMLTNGNDVAGYAIATVSDYPDLGKCGWLNPGAFSILPGYDDALPELYERIGQSWLDCNIIDHYIFVPAPRGEFSEVWSELGFAKQQSHGILNLEKRRNDAENENLTEFSIRHARSSDTDQIATFSAALLPF